jgi:tetratricopeptide (TPR) repeat protein
MRATKNASADDIRERHLGEIAPLLDAARQVDSLSEVQKRQVRKRIVRTLFRTRSLNLRVRLVPVLIALGMLVIGGAAFATAERLGLISRVGAKTSRAPVTQPKPEARKRRGSGARPATPVRETSEPETSASDSEWAFAQAASVALPEVPDPLLLPAAEASAVGWSPAMASAVAPAKPLRRAANLVAYAVSAPLGAAPAPVMSAPALAYAGKAAFREPFATVELAAPQLQPVRPSVIGSAAPAAAVAHVVPAAQPAVSAPAVQPAEVAKPVAAVAPASPEPLGDQALFGQAMRKLRMEKDPSAALSALQEHAKAYPHSSLGGERAALEVEALLALHRDSDALARLDAMTLDELPRSGERFVVRGELRAAARRWLEASADFDRALSRVSGAPSWHERALWGRGAARLRCGEREAGLADFERYLDKYPDGRFAPAAAKFFPNR